MAGDPYRRAQPGERLRIPAAAWNRLMDNAMQMPLASQGDEFSYRRTNFRIYCQNKTSGTIPQWGVLHIDGVLPTPSGATGAATNQFQTFPAISGITPTGTTQAGFVVAVEQIERDKLGMVAIDGVVQVKLDIKDPSHRFAKPKPGSTSQLETAASGDASILWKESGTGANKWGLVRIGAGAGGGVKIGKITGTWTKYATQTVWEYTAIGFQATGPSGPLSLTGANFFATILASGSASKWVALTNIDSEWHLIAAEC